MFRCGLLLLSNRLPVISSNIASILDSALQHVSDCLYIHIAPEGCLQATQSDMPEAHIPTTTGIKQLVTEVYISTTKYARKTDVRLLLNNFSVEGCQPSSPYRLKQSCDVVLLAGVEDASLHERAVSYASQVFPDSLLSNISTKSLPVKLPSDMKSDSGGDEHCKIYEHICLGGTFDRLHNGHKLLLSQGVLLCTGSLTVGVTDGDMNKRKVLGELMEPTSKRIAAVLDFVQDIKPSLQYKGVPITDPYGPAIVDGSLQCIVVSPETLRGAHAVNTKREQADLSQLDVELIDILPESQPTEADAEEKMSSSNQRIRLLGTLLDSSKCTPRQSASKPYVIGLTGGIASGKSSVCQRLQALGAAIIDCDKLGHQTYQKGTKTWNDVVSTFGRDILKEDGEIDRRALGGKVFADKSELEKLNGIVWPAIADLVKTEIDRLQSLGKEVIVLDAAVLLEAGWDKSCQEVWVCIVPVEEATKRLMERNNLTEAQATQRISSQLSNQERVNRASVVLSTLWEPQVTQKQVEKAWRLLLSRVSSPSAD